MYADLFKWLVSASVVCMPTLSFAYSPTWPEAPLVQELLFLEAQKALQDLTNKDAGAPGLNSPLPSDAEQEEAAPTVQEQVELLGIFGMGNSLFADVKVNGTKMRFQRGQAHPVNAASGVAYRLRSIASPCVRLQGPSGDLTACIEKTTQLTN